MVIWKFKLEITDVQVVRMPAGAKILSVANQDGNLCLWAMVHTESPNVDRKIEILGTGNPIPLYRAPRTFIGTAIIGRFVWHVFESAV